MFPEQTPPEDEQQNPQPSRAGRLVPWLFVLGMGLLFLPLYLVSGAIQDTNVPLATEVEQLQATITAPPPVPPEEATLAQQLSDMRSEYAALQPIPLTLIATHVDWPAITAVVQGYDADQIRLTGFNNSGGRLTLEGNALQENAVLEYARVLERTGYFSRVNVQSITVNPVPPVTPNPNMTPTPGASLTELYMPFVFTLTVDLIVAGS